MGYGNVSLSQKIISYCLSSFQTCKQYKWAHYKHPKKEISFGMSQLKRFNFKNQIQN